MLHWRVESAVCYFTDFDRILVLKQGQFLCPITKSNHPCASMMLPPPLTNSTLLDDLFAFSVSDAKTPWYRRFR
jgi:hypothetical protein